MKVSLNIDRDYEETKVTIECPELDDSVQEILDFIKGQETEFLVGKDGDMQHILKPDRYPLLPYRKRRRCRRYSCRFI